MRLMLAFAVLALAACNVDSDGGNDTVTLEYNQQRIEEGAAKAARTAESVGSSVGNVAEGTARAIKDEVGDIDVDVKRRRPGEEAANAAAMTNSQ
ncbi:MAG TPA: hypothetical protein VHM92_10360 [Allosphingosinicella sp.]|nr:hypothetical protein [Allosphingosinicella sp.]